MVVEFLTYQKLGQKMREKENRVKHKRKKVKKNNFQVNKLFLHASLNFIT